jgi:glyoxylase-like metal-dependent hydrolase (beta-lactamase superfamily II)
MTHWRSVEVVRGIHQIEGVRGANSYMVLSGGDGAVIDTGMPGNEKKIIGYARRLGIEPANLRFIILTHPDMDHSGSVAALKNLTGAKVAIHEFDAPRLAGEKKLKEVKGPLGGLFSVMGVFMRFTPVRPDILLGDSDEILDLKVIHTPGHTDGSICLLRENEAIFVGDAMRTDSGRRPRLPSGPMTADMEKAKESLKRIATYQYGALLPGHGPPITSGAAGVMAAFANGGFVS